MLYSHFTEKLLGLKGAIVKNIDQTEKFTSIEIEIERKPHNCPCCGTSTRTIHDYRRQKIKDIPAFGKNILLYLRKRRYRCLNCGKRFYEENGFLPKYHRMTNRLCAYVIQQLTDVRSFSSVAREVNLSVATVIRIFDLVQYAPCKLPSVLSIDEFKGNTDREKYQCVITDPVSRRILDILSSRENTVWLHILRGLIVLIQHILSVICGVHTPTYRILSSKMQPLLWTNAIIYGRQSGLLKL